MYWRYDHGVFSFAPLHRGGNGTIIAFSDLAGSPNPFVNFTTLFALAPANVIPTRGEQIAITGLLRVQPVVPRVDSPNRVLLVTAGRIDDEYAVESHGPRELRR